MGCLAWARDVGLAAVSAGFCAFGVGILCIICGARCCVGWWEPALSGRTGSAFGGGAAFRSAWGGVLLWVWLCTVMLVSADGLCRGVRSSAGRFSGRAAGLDGWVVRISCAGRRLGRSDTGGIIILALGIRLFSVAGFVLALALAGIRCTADGEGFGLAFLVSGGSRRLCLGGFSRADCFVFHRSADDFPFRLWSWFCCWFSLNSLNRFISCRSVDRFCFGSRGCILDWFPLHGAG